MCCAAGSHASEHLALQPAAVRALSRGHGELARAQSSYVQREEILPQCSFPSRATGSRLLGCADAAGPGLGEPPGA